ncbi:hypothetical protein [Streptomyces yangpuensis]
MLRTADGARIRGPYAGLPAALRTASVPVVAGRPRAPGGRQTYS